MRLCECGNPSVTCGDSSLYTREPLLRFFGSFASHLPDDKRPSCVL